MLIHDIIPSKKKIKKTRSKSLKGFSVSNCHPERVERVEKSRVYARKINRWLHCGGALWSLFAKRLFAIFSEITKGSTALTGLWSQRHSQRNKRKLTASVLTFLLILQTIIGIFTPINISVTPPYISPQETKAAGSWVVGSGGDSWNGDVTMDNTTDIISDTGHITLSATKMDDFNRADNETVNTFWTEDYAGTDDLDIESNQLKIICAENNYAHVEFNNTKSNITIQAKMKVNASSAMYSWSPGLMMYWNDSNFYSVKLWAATGMFTNDRRVNGTGDGMSVGTMTKGTYYPLKIIINNGNITSYYSDDSKATWTQIHTMSLPVTYTDTPPIIIMGKGWPGTNPDMDNSHTTPGNTYYHYADDFFRIPDYVINGTLTSISKDSETIGSASDLWKQISFTGTVDATKTVNIEVDASDDDSNWMGWTTVQNSASSSTTYNIPSTHQKRYGKYRLILNTTDVSQTPEIQSVVFIAGNVAPNVPVLVSPSDGTYTLDNTPTLSANYSDNNSGDTGTTNYRIATSASNCLNGTVVASGTSSATSDEDEDTTWTPSSSIGSDGTYYWCARNDDGIAQSAFTAMGNFVLDTATPDIVSIDVGASSADRISLTSNTWFKYTSTGSDDQISFSWIDPASTSDDTFYYELNSNSGNTVTGDESAATNPYLDDIIITEGTNYFHVRPRNGVSVWGTERIFIVKYDKTNPTVSLSSPANSSSTSDNTPAFTWSGSDATSGIAKYQLYIDSVLDTDNISATSVIPANELSCGSHTWYIRAYDNVDNYTDSNVFNLNMSCGGGLPPSASNPPVQPEPTTENPEGGFSVLINNGDEYTNSEVVTLKLYAGKDTNRMAISNTEDFKYASQIPYQKEIQWDLSSGRNEAVPRSYGTNTVYVKFYTQYGVASEIVLDSIILKTATAENQSETSNQEETKSSTESNENSKSEENIATENNQSISFTFTQTLQFGSNNPEVKTLQDKLKELNFFSKEIISNGNFGPATEKAIKEYQKSKGIHPCGIVGPRTRKALNNGEFITNKDYKFTKDLKYSDKNEEVKQLQIRLQDQNFFPYNVKPTGWFGSITKKAVNIFQKFYNLIQSGVVDEGMREVLNK